MARVKVCPVCGHRNPQAALECEQDSISLADTLLVDEWDLARNNGTSGPNTDPVQGIPGDPSRETSHVALEFPWGTVEIRERLNIGRDPAFSPLADRLKDRDHVSRRHAELWVEDGLLKLRHFGTTNPTYINGQAIKPDCPVILADGEEIGFSRHLTAIVRLG